VEHAVLVRGVVAAEENKMLVTYEQIQTNSVRNFAQTFVANCVRKEQGNTSLGFWSANPSVSSDLV
jgi:hypothetical protein